LRDAEKPFDGIAGIPNGPVAFAKPAGEELYQSLQSPHAPTNTTDEANMMNYTDNQQAAGGTMHTLPHKA